MCFLCLGIIPLILNYSTFLHLSHNNLVVFFFCFFLKTSGPNIFCLILLSFLSFAVCFTLFYTCYLLRVDAVSKLPGILVIILHVIVKLLPLERCNNERRIVIVGSQRCAAEMERKCKKGMRVAEVFMLCSICCS